jgi:DNA-binding GntR family transcriptional regulator
LTALERHRVVVKWPRHGYFVTKFAGKDVEEVYGLRELLEKEALRRVISRCTDKDVREMARILDKLDEAAHAREDHAAIVALDLSWHECLCRIADHSRLYSAWDSIRMQTLVLLGITSRTYYSDPEGPGRVHRAILDAIKDRDLRRAESALSEHFADAQLRALTALRVTLRDGGSGEPDLGG